MGRIDSSLLAVDALAIDIMLPASRNRASAWHHQSQRPLAGLTPFLTGFGPLQLIFGPLTDCFGRRSVILIGLVGYVLTSVACALVPSFDYARGSPSAQLSTLLT